MTVLYMMGVGGSGRGPGAADSPLEGGWGRGRLAPQLPSGWYL